MKGFTLIEMLLVMGLFLFIGTFSVLNLKGGNNIQDARREALRLVATAREMQRRTLSGSLAPEVGVSAPKGGYGIRVNADGPGGAVGVSYDAVVAQNVNDFMPSNLKILRTVTLPKSMTIAPANFIVLFTQPKGVLCAKVGGGTPFCGLCPDFAGTCTSTTCTCQSPWGNNSLATSSSGPSGWNQTLLFSMDQPNIARVVIDLVGARLSAQ